MDIHHDSGPTNSELLHQRHSTSYTSFWLGWAKASPTLITHLRKSLHLRMHVCECVCNDTSFTCSSCNCVCASQLTCAHTNCKDRQRSLHVNSKCSSPNKVQLRTLLKLTSHAGRLRERTAGIGEPRETMPLFIVSVQSMIWPTNQPEPVARRDPEQELSI